ncbi:MAG: GNAT family N-acetyltransferase [Sarcina sp.]
MNIIIRKPEFYELKHLINLHEDLAMLHSDCFNEIFKKTNSKTDKNLYSNSLENIWVAEVNNKIVGSICIDIKETKENDELKYRKYIWIEELVVVKEFRKNGIATKLVKNVIEFAKDRNIKYIELNVWKFKDGASEFYEKIGFKVMSERRQYKELK